MACPMEDRDLATHTSNPNKVDSDGDGLNDGDR